MPDGIRIRVTTRMGLVGCVTTDEIGMPREDWDAMTTQQREDAVREAALENVEWYAQEIDTDGNTLDADPIDGDH